MKKCLFVKGFIPSFLLVFVLFLVTACSNVIAPLEGSVVVTLPGGRFSSSDIRNYAVEVVGSGQAVQEGEVGKTVVFSGIEPGNYTVKVTAFDETGNAIYVGEKGAIVESGKPAIVTIELEVVTVLITFDNGTEGQYTRNVPYGESLPVNEFNKEEKVFNYWKTESGDIYLDGAISDITESTTLYANWGITHPIIFHANYNGATEASTRRDVYAGQSFTLENPLSREGYTLTGWSTEQDSTDIVYSDGESITLTKDLNLYAQWAVSSVDALQSEIDAGNTTIPVASFTVTEPIKLTQSVKLQAASEGVVLTASSELTDAMFSLESSTSSYSVTLGSGEHSLILDGSQNASSVVKVVSGTTVNLEKNVVIRNFSSKGVEIDGGTVKLNGGTITSTVTTATGTGVYINSGTFTMNSGTISDIKSENDGAGVYINGGTFDMKGGSLVGNTSERNGGGVYINSSGIFTMSGGNIQGNMATKGNGGNTSEGNGGGVYINSNGIFNMSGGTIQGNTANQGNGVYHNGGIFKMSGSTMVNTDNEVYLNGTSITFGSFVGSHVIARITLNNYEDYTNSKQVLIKESNAQTLTEDVTNRFSVTPDGGATEYVIYTDGYLWIKGTTPN